MSENKDASSVHQISWSGIIGFLVFIAGIILALVSGIVKPSSADTRAEIVLALAIMGIIVGLLNITAKEVLLLMVAAIALLVVGQAIDPVANKPGFEILDRVAGGLGTTIDQMLYYFGRLMAPAAVIGAVRALLAVGFPGD